MKAQMSADEHRWTKTRSDRRASVFIGGSSVFVFLVTSWFLSFWGGCGTRVRQEGGEAPGPFVEGPVLPFRHETGGRTPLDIRETAGAGCAMLDADGDGRLDLFLVGGGTKGQSPNALFHNNGDGSFTDITARAGVGPAPAYGMGCAAGDFDGDGRVDLYVTGDGG